MPFAVVFHAPRSPAAQSPSPAVAPQCRGSASPGCTQTSARRPATPAAPAGSRPALSAPTAAGIRSRWAAAAAANGAHSRVNARAWTAGRCASIAAAKAAAVRTWWETRRPRGPRALVEERRLARGGAHERHPRRLVKVVVGVEVREPDRPRVVRDGEGAPAVLVVAREVVALRQPARRSSVSVRLSTTAEDITSRDPVANGTGPCSLAHCDGLNCSEPSGSAPAVAVQPRRAKVPQFTSPAKWRPEPSARTRAPRARASAGAPARRHPSSRSTRADPLGREAPPPFVLVRDSAVAPFAQRILQHAEERRPRDAAPAWGEDLVDDEPHRRPRAGGATTKLALAGGYTPRAASGAARRRAPASFVRAAPMLGACSPERTASSNRPLDATRRKRIGAAALGRAACRPLHTAAAAVAAAGGRTIGDAPGFACCGSMVEEASRRVFHPAARARGRSCWRARVWLVAPRPQYFIRKDHVWRQPE